MQVLVTLNSGQGVNLGPNFTLSANIGSVTPNTATLTELLAGKSVTTSDTATYITITSTGLCTNSLILNFRNYPTTTTTTTAAPTTTTTTAAPTTTTTAAPTTTTTTGSPTTTTTGSPTTTTTGSPTTTTTGSPTTTTTGSPTTTTTGSPTTTTTTTKPLVYYRLYNCASGTSLTWSIPYTLGTFNIGDRVVKDADSSTNVIDYILYSSPGGTLYSITGTASTGCPATTTTTSTTSTSTTTTTLPLVYYQLYNCASGTYTTWTIPYTLGTFNINDRVIKDADSSTNIIYAISYSTPGGILYSVTATAGTGCPATTTTTTTTTTTLAPTTTTTTQAPISNGFIATCTGNTQTITINALSGGDGTNYYANDTTYIDAISAQSGPTSLVTSGFRTYTNQPSGTRYIFIYSGSRNTVTFGGQACTTTTTTTTLPPTTTTTTSTTTTTTTIAPLTYLFNAVAAALACDTGTSVAVYGLGASASDTQFIAGHTYYYNDRVLLNVSGYGDPTGNYWMDSSGNAWVITNGVPISSLAC